MPKGKTSRPYNRDEKKAIATKKDITAFKKNPSVGNYFRGVRGTLTGNSLMVAQNTLERRERKEQARKIGQRVNIRGKK
jgi:hypothetical protein